MERSICIPTHVILVASNYQEMIPICLVNPLLGFRRLGVLTNAVGAVETHACFLSISYVFENNSSLLIKAHCIFVVTLVAMDVGKAEQSEGSALSVANVNELHRMS